MVNALSRKSLTILFGLMVKEWKMYDYISEFHPCFDLDESEICFYTLVAQPTMLHKVIEVQRSDEKLDRTRSQVMVGEVSEGWSIHANGGIYFLDRLCVSDDA